MDELIALAVRRLAEKAAQSGQPADATAERYQQMLDALRARAGAPSVPVSAQSAVAQTVAQPSAPAVTPSPAPTIIPSVPTLLSDRPGPSAPAPPPPAGRQEHGPLQGLFEGGNSLVRAVIAAELLDRPLALRENAYWQKR